MVYQNTNDEGETYFMVSWKFISNRVKGGKLNNKFVNTTLFNDQYTTLPGDTVYKKRHHLYVKVSLAKDLSWLIFFAQNTDDDNFMRYIYSSSFQLQTNFQ